MRQAPEVLSVKTVAESNLFTIESVDLTFSNGQSRSYERFANRNNPAVMIVPMPAPDRILLIREYGAGLGDYYISFPKGGIEPGETLEETAQRELREEVGLGAHALRHLMTLSNSPSYSSSRMSIWVATDLFVAPAEGDEPESIEVLEWSLKNLPALMEHPEFHEARALAALLFLSSQTT